MKNCIILEWDDHTNELLDIISVQGHHFKKIVCQQPSRVQLSSVYSSVLVESWDAFSPQANETYFCGLIGKKAQEFCQPIQNNFGIQFTCLIHPHALISPTAKIGLGSVISAGVIIASSVIIGKGCFVGLGVILGHDTVLEDYVIIRAGAKLAGHITVKEGTIIDMGATIIEDVQIGSDVVVEAGAVVLKNVSSQTVVSGIPAKIKQ